MKLPCTLNILDRSLSSNGKKSNKPVNSTIAICKHPNADKHCLLIFNSKNATGTKYNVNGNIQKVHTKFLDEGKITLQFTNPPHDIYVQATVILMKSFVNILRGIVTGKSKDLKTHSLSVSVPKKNFVVPTKLVIKKRSEYPTKGFPPTLETLTIEGIQRCSLDLGILRLTNLKVLNLSDNCITTLPESFSFMKSLRVLDISKNHFHQSRDWRWLSRNLCETLVSLSMASNNLKSLPIPLIKLKNLNSLDVSNNKLRELPNGIGCLRKLKSFNLHTNDIERLPGSIKCLRLEQINVSDNSFNSSNKQLISSISVSSEKSLKSLAAGRVLELGFKYDASIIPATLALYLDLEAKYCLCGKPCFTFCAYQCGSLNLSTVSDSVTTNPESGLTVNIDCFFCSQKCAGIYNPKRMTLIR